MAATITIKVKIYDSADANKARFTPPNKTERMDAGGNNLKRKKELLGRFKYARIHKVCIKYSSGKYTVRQKIKLA